MKKEKRVLAYGLLRDHVVIATYRWNFLEELYISQQPILDLESYIKNRISTYSEVTYIVPCTEDKYANRFKSFRVIEGGEFLIYREKYCRIVLLILCLLEENMSLTLSRGVLISDLDRCLNKGVNV